LSRSSIFSFDTLRPGPVRAPWGAIGAVVVVLGCELLLRAAAPWLPDPVLWGSNEVSAKVEQAKQMAAAGRAPADVLILGPSHASVGVSPREMTPALNIYNGALNGRTYPALEFVYEHVYEPLLKPRALVLAVSPIVLNAHNRWMERNSEQLFRADYPSALRATGLMGVWRRFLVDHVALYRYRHRQAGLRDGWVARHRRLDEYGFTDPGTTTYRPSPSGLPLDHPYRRIMHAYDFSGPSVDAFVRLLARAQAHGIPVAVVNMPFRPAMLEISADGREHYGEYLEAMERLQRRFGFTWLDYQSELSFVDAEFRDIDHLNAAGVRKLSRRLHQDLPRAIGRDADARGGSDDRRNAAAALRTHLSDR
jgi:hypothetical protein